jgi:hypothetical protein
MAKEIANVSSTTVAMPSFLQAKLGENRQQIIDKEDVGVPRLKLLQPLSPEVDELDQTPGTFFNTVTGEAMTELSVHNLGFQIHYLVSGDPAKGGSRDMFVGAFHTEADAQAALDASEDADVLTVSRSHRHILYVVETGEVAAMDFGTITSIGVSRMWNAAILAESELPRCARSWHLTAKKRKNEKGFWYVVDYKRGDYIQTEDEYSRLVALEESFKEPAELKAA